MSSLHQGAVRDQLCALMGREERSSPIRLPDPAEVRRFNRDRKGPGPTLGPTETSLRIDILGQATSPWNTAAAKKFAAWWRKQPELAAICDDGEELKDRFKRCLPGLKAKHRRLKLGAGQTGEISDFEAKRDQLTRSQRKNVDRNRRKSVRNLSHSGLAVPFIPSIARLTPLERCHRSQVPRLEPTCPILGSPGGP